MNNQIIEMLEAKQKEMIDFLNQHLSESDRQRIGQDIIRIMPNAGDIAKIQISNINE